MLVRIQQEDRNTYHMDISVGKTVNGTYVGKSCNGLIHGVQARTGGIVYRLHLVSRVCCAWEEYACAAHALRLRLPSCIILKSCTQGVMAIFLFPGLIMRLVVSRLPTLVPLCASDVMLLNF